MPKSLAEIVIDPEFRSLPVADQEYIIKKITTEHLSKASKAEDLAGVQGAPPSVPNLGDELLTRTGGIAGHMGAQTVNQQALAQSPIQKALDSSAGNIPFLGKQSLGDRMYGAGTGAMTGALLGPAGMASGALFGALMPPENAGDLTAQAAMPFMGKGTAPLINLGKKGYGKTAMAGLLGMLEGTGANAIDAGVNKAIDPNNRQSFTPSAANLIPSAVGPMLGQMLLANKVKARPTTKSFEFANQETGLPAINEMDSLGQFKDKSGAEAARVAGRGTLPTDLEANTAAGKPLQVDLEKAKRLKASVDEQIKKNNTITANVDAMRTIQEQKLTGNSDSTQKILDDVRANKAQLQSQNSALKLQKEKLLANADQQHPSVLKPVLDQIDEKLKQNDLTGKQLDIQEFHANQQLKWDQEPINKTLGEYDNKTKGIKSSTAALNLEKQKLTNKSDLLNQSLADLKEQSNSWNAENPWYQGIVKDSTDTTSLLQNIQKSTPEGVQAYYKHLESLPNGKQHVEALRGSLVDDFFRQSYDPNSKTLANAPKLMEPNGPYSQEKLAAIFGGDKEGIARAGRFQQAVTDIQKLADNEKNSGAGQMAQYALRHSTWVLPNMIVFHPEILTPAHVGGLAVGTATLLASVGYDKLVDQILKNPKFGSYFHQWATGTSRQARSLSNWPSLAAKMQDLADTQKVPSYAEKQISGAITPGAPTMFGNTTPQK